MALVGSITDIEKVDDKLVLTRIAELEKKIEDRKKSTLSLYNNKLDIANKSFLEDARKSDKKDEVCLAYYKRVAQLAKEFREKY